MADLTCYYCDSIATSEEHAPPKCIFPRTKDTKNGTDYRNNLIKVPSCDEHNTLKSKEDEYLLYVLAMSLPSNDVAKNQFLTKILRAINRRPKLIERLLIETQKVRIHDTINDTWHETIAIEPEEHRLISIFTHIAKAIYFHELGSIWDKEISILIEFMLSFDDLEQNKRQEVMEKEINAMLNGVPKKGKNPDVFSYQFVQTNSNI